MEGEAKRDFKKWAPAFVVILSLAVFLYLRLRNLNHLLLWDEAQFVLYTRSFVNGTNDQWGMFINLHPPVYLWISALLYQAGMGGALSLEMVSILFSLGTLLVTWRVADFLFGRMTGALAMFFLAVMPASTVIDTWIKQDAAAVFFLTLTIYLFLRKKYVWGGVALGLGMLSKEIAVFALLALGAYAVLSWRRSLVLGVVKVGLIGAALSFWWYVWVSDYVGHFGDFFLGRGIEAGLWGKPWHYYFSGLPVDLGWPILAAAAAGVLACLWRRFKGDSTYLLPLAWFFSIYIFLTLSYGKPYWMVAPALPAAAILASIGTMEATGWVRGRIPVERYARAAQGALVAVLMLGALLGAAFTGYPGYNRGRFSAYWTQAELSRQDADLLLENLREGDKILVVFNDVDRWDPTLVYYLGDADYIPATSAMLDDPEDLAAYARAIGAGWIFLGVDPAYEDSLNGFLSRMESLLQVTELYISNRSFIVELAR